MKLNEICENVAIKLLGKPGTLVEFMWKSGNLGKSFGMVCLVDGSSTLGKSLKLDRISLPLPGYQNYNPCLFRLFNEDAES